MRTSLIHAAMLSAVIFSAGLAMPGATALADPPGGRHGAPWDGGHRGDRDWHRRPPPGDYGRRPPPFHGYPRHDRGWYPRSRHYHYHGDDFLGWLAFSVVALAIIDDLDERQQREHELAMRESLRAPVGETIRWRDSNAAGSVTTVREGTSSQGRYCREYVQDVRIGGQAQKAYGTACRNADGSWEIID